MPFSPVAPYHLGELRLKRLRRRTNPHQQLLLIVAHAATSSWTAERPLTCNGLMWDFRFLRGSLIRFSQTLAWTRSFGTRGFLQRAEPLRGHGARPSAWQLLRPPARVRPWVGTSTSGREALQVAYSGLLPPLLAPLLRPPTHVPLVGGGRCVGCSMGAVQESSEAVMEWAAAGHVQP